MNLNATLLGQMITFAILIGFTMRFVWPPVIAALNARQKKIADGIAAAEEAEQELAMAKQEKEVILQGAKQEAIAIVEQANKKAGQVIEEAKMVARHEGERILLSVKAEAGQVYKRAQDELKNRVVALVLFGTEKILGRSVSAEGHQDILEGLLTDLRSSPKK
ncbi:MAG: F0F1 ATP synthase subunit B [Gammaproteobacteria bacterium]|nr:F0F1 ATP synthase subunit B [Gammaproteobacteria bacterium]